MSHTSSATDAPSRDVIARFENRKWRHVAPRVTFPPPTALPGGGAAAVGSTQLLPFIESALQGKDNFGYLYSNTHTPRWRVICIRYTGRATSRRPLRTMETCSSSHKKQKRSNAAENWVSAAVGLASPHRRLAVPPAAAPTSSQWAK